MKNYVLIVADNPLILQYLHITIKVVIIEVLIVNIK